MCLVQPGKTEYKIKAKMIKHVLNYVVLNNDSESLKTQNSELLQVQVLLNKFVCNTDVIQVPSDIKFTFAVFILHTPVQYQYSQH